MERMHPKRVSNKPGRRGHLVTVREKGSAETNTAQLMTGLDNAGADTTEMASHDAMSLGHEPS